MSDWANQLEEIETLISSNTNKADKSFAYSSLLHLQEQSNNDPSAIQALAKCSHILLSLILTDISNDDEEVAAQALKCLGFIIYHPSLVVTVPENVANLVVESLVKLVVTTKMKAICNLGVWCISIQQFDASFLASHIHSLLRAIIHALENPIGSLSTTFEAMQAVMKLATQLSEKMRELSNIWAPSIYRRLISTDKRERDMSERCLLKIRCSIFPPPLTLSKTLVVDIKKKLLPGMKELLDHGMTVEAIQAWGWFIRLLGSHAMNNRHLVNEMLKIPEQTFPHHEPQVQIASQVAWEGLIDALIHPPIQAPLTNTVRGQEIQVGTTTPDASKGNGAEKQANLFTKSIKLIMKPLVGIMSSKCDISVHSSCLNTWCYLLHKLDILVNLPSVVKTVLEPIFEVIFRMGPESKSICLWNSCIDLLDDHVSAKSKDVDYELDNQVSSNLTARVASVWPTTHSKLSWNDYPIKWLPWDLSKLDFHIKMIRVLVSQGSMLTLSPEKRSLACTAALRVFRSVLKGVQIELKKSSINYNEVMFCLNTILRFTKEVCEGVQAKDIDKLQFVEAVTKELETKLLASLLYRVTLDIKYIENLQSFSDVGDAKVLGICSIAYMDMVSPMVYLIVLYLCVVFQSSSDVLETKFFLQGMHRFLTYILSSYDPPENLNAVISLLYKHMGFSGFKIWIVIARCLADYIDGVKDLLLFKSQSDSTGYVTFCWFLSYAFSVCSCPQKLLTQVKTSGHSGLCLVSTQGELELDLVIDVWRSFYGSVNNASQSDCCTMNGFSEDLCAILTQIINENTSVLGCDIELQKQDKTQLLVLLSLIGEVVIGVSKQIVVLNISFEGSQNKDDGDKKLSSDIKNYVEFVARFMRLSLESTETCPQSLAVTSRVFSALESFVGHLHLKQDILLFFEIICDPLCMWLSCVEMQEKESIVNQLQLLWTEILNCLQRSWPAISFDSSFLGVQATLLETTLDHPNAKISEPAVAFWNSTYGEQTKLEFPRSLLHVLDRLSRSGRINLHGQKLPFSANSIPHRYWVTATQKRSSKRVEFMEDIGRGFEYNDKSSANLKKKKLELTEHQKEVRRAQQGRERDCNGRGPGIRTYTSVDFSQGNEDSQESQEIRNPDSILGMLRRAG